MEIVRKIKVLVIGDSLLFREVIVRGISQDPFIKVVGSALDAFEAVNRIMKLSPDVLVLDLEMPRMNGTEFLKKLVPQYPLPAVVVSTVSGNVFNALDAGAVDFVTKPEASSKEEMQTFVNELAVKVKTASTAKVGHFKKDYCYDNVIYGSDIDYSNTVIAIGASTGGIEAVSQLVSVFPRDMSGIVIVQHMPHAYIGLYTERLNRICRMEAKVAEDGDWVGTGRILLASGDCHIMLNSIAGGYYVNCSKDNNDGNYPPIDVFFDSVAASAGSNAVGVLLTGMGSDGAKGLLNMKRCGAYTIGQDEKTCVVYEMPMAAYNIGAVTRQVPLEKIPQAISGWLAVKQRASGIYSINVTNPVGQT